MAQWQKLKFDTKMVRNMSEDLLSTGMATVENAIYNDAGGQSKFPGLDMFAEIPCARSYVWSWRNDMIVVTDRGSIYRVDLEGRVQDITGAPLSGHYRPIFDRTEDQLVIAAGGPIVSIGKSKSVILSKDAPLTTHVCYIDGRLIAIEQFSGRAFYCEVGDYSNWPALNTLVAESKPDDLNAAVVTPYGELLLCGVDSIEQFATVANGNNPLVRRWTSGEGLGQGWTLCATTQGTYGVNSKNEFVRWNGQTNSSESGDVDLAFEMIDDWTDAWSVELLIKGQKLILLQMPNATTPYETKGMTFLLDYRKKKWSLLYGFDPQTHLPTRWPGWSYKQVWGRHFVGVPGGVAEMKIGNFSDRGEVMPMRLRTGHMDDWGLSRVDDFEIRLKRGSQKSGTVPQTNVQPIVGVRANLDGMGFMDTYWLETGRFGERELLLRTGGWGVADTWQFELIFTDRFEYEFVGCRALVEPIAR